MAYRWAPLAKVEDYAPVARSLGVSRVALSRGQFVDQYRRAGGDWRLLSPWWRNRRDNFVKRHLAQAYKSGERLHVAGEGYSRRGLALLMWAYDPAR